MEHAVEDERACRAGPIVRPYGDTTGDGMVQVSFTLPLPHDKRAEGAALQLAAKMGLEPALLVHAKAMGPDFTFFVVYGSVTHLVDVREVEVRRARVPAADLQGDQRRDQEAAAPQARRRRRLHRHRRPHRRHRRHPQHQGLRRREGPGVLPRDDGGQPRRPGARARPGQHRPRGARGCRARLAGGHPEGRPHPQHHGDVGGLPRGVPRRQVPLLVVGRSALRGGLGRRPLGVDRVFGRGTTPGEVASLPRAPSSSTPRTHPDPRGAQR